MNRTKDGHVHGRIAGAGRNRIGESFNGRSLACRIAAVALLKLCASAPHACGAQSPALYDADVVPRVAANRAMRLTMPEKSDVVPPASMGGLAASRAASLDDDLEPVTPESIGMVFLPDPAIDVPANDPSCELRELEESLAMLDEEKASVAFQPLLMDSVEERSSEVDEEPAEMTAEANDCGDSARFESSQVVAVAMEEAEVSPMRVEESAPVAKTDTPCLDREPSLPMYAVTDNPPAEEAERTAASDRVEEQSSREEPVVLAMVKVMDQEPCIDEWLSASRDAVADPQPREEVVAAQSAGSPAQDESAAATMADALVMGPFVTDVQTLPLFAILDHSTDVEDSRPEPMIQEDSSDESAQSEASEEVEWETREADEDSPRSESPAIPMHEAVATTPPAASSDIVAGVSILSESAQRITVGKNSSAAIDLKVDCDRAEIADPAIADIMVVSPKRLVVSGKSFGTTQMILRVGQQQKVFTVAVELDLSLLANVIHSVSPTANVQPRSVNGTIVLGGTVPDSQTGDRIAEMAALFQGGQGQVRNQMTVAGVQQTMLRVVVAEVNKEAVRQLGFNWAIGGADWTRDFFFANNVSNLNPTVFSSNGSTNIGGSPTPQITYSVAPTGNTAATNLTFGFPRAEFQVFMQALRQNSLARVLAEPNLVAISGQTATFLAGGEVPIPVTQGGAVAGSITIEYKEFGVRLAFTPTVLAGQIIRLHVMSEVSDAIPGDTIAGGLPVFSFTTRRVESTVECGNGQTFAMAGLLNDKVQAVARKLPGLGDVPILGALFSSVEYQKDNTELVVLVTPQLVEPLDPQQVPPPPGSLMTDPNDYELFALGQLEGVPNEPPSSEDDSHKAPSEKMTPVSLNGRPSSHYALRGPWGLADIEEN